MSTTSLRNGLVKLRVVVKLRSDLKNLLLGTVDRSGRRVNVRVSVMSPLITLLSSVGLTFEARFATRLASFEKLFPADELSMRTASSRTDGYWPFVARKEEPPLAFTYGEFPLSQFTEAVDRACVHAGLEARHEATFLDIGSGAGRLVLWAAVTDEWKAVHGVELLPSLHTTACEKLEEARALRQELALRTSEVSFAEGSWEDASVLPWSDVDVAFAYTTAFPACEETATLDELTRALAARLRKGCVVCTTDYQLGAGFELLEQLEFGGSESAATPENGGRSTAFLFRKTCEGVGAAEVLAEQLAASEERVATLEAKVATLEAELERSGEEATELRRERDEVRARLDETDELSDLTAWASGSGYFEEDTSTSESGDDEPPREPPPPSGSWWPWGGAKG